MGLPRRRRVPEALALLAWVLCFLAAADPLAAAAGQKVPQETVEYAIWQDGPNLDVTQVFLGRPGDRSALLPGARDVSVPAGETAIILPGAMAIPEGGTRGEVSYVLSFPPSGLSLSVPSLTPTKLVFVMVGEGVSFPIVLNQAFFAGGKYEALGHDFTVYVAKGFDHPFRLNVERSAVTAGFDLQWLWILPFLAIAAYLLARQRKKHA